MIHGKAYLMSRELYWIQLRKSQVNTLCRPSGLVRKLARIDLIVNNLAIAIESSNWHSKTSIQTLNRLQVSIMKSNNQFTSATTPVSHLCCGARCIRMDADRYTLTKRIKKAQVSLSSWKGKVRKKKWRAMAAVKQLQTWLRHTTASFGWANVMGSVDLWNRMDRYILESG